MQTVLVAADACMQFEGVLETALKLARPQQATLRGLFVEDLILLRVAALPFTQEICLSSALIRPLNPDDLRRRMRVLADRMRNRLAAAAEQARLQWTFQVQQGSMIQSVYENSIDADVILCGWRQITLPQRASRHTHSRQAPIVVLDDGSASSARALAFARQLRQNGEHRDVVVLALPDALDEHRNDLEAAAAESPTAWVRVSPVKSATQLIQEARRLQPWIFLMGRDDQRPGRPELEAWLNQLGCPVAIVR